MNMIILAIHFNKYRIKIRADIGKDDFELIQEIFIKDASTVFCDKNQMNMNIKYAISTMP